MPFRSEKQRRFLWAAHPDIAKRWAHDYPKPKKLPMYVADKDKKQESEEKAAMKSTNNLHFDIKSLAAKIYSINSKQAESTTVKINIPHSEEPTAAGENPVTAKDTGRNSKVCAPVYKKQENSLFNKLSAVLSQPIMQALENEKAEAEARAAQLQPMNTGIKRYAMPAAATPPPMGMAQAPAQPAPAQAPSGQLPPVGGGSSPNANPINSYGALSSTGDITGNAAFGTANSVGGEKMATGAGSMFSNLLRGAFNRSNYTAPATPPAAQTTWRPKGLVNTLPAAPPGVNTTHPYSEYLRTLTPKPAGESFPTLRPPVSNMLVGGEKASASSPAWQRSAGKNPEGGLNEKGRKSYERETGGNLKAPVTESNPKGERAKRQNSFCSRMCGMKRVNTGAETKSDPDSRINKSLRKWNCKCSSAMEFGIKMAARGDMAKKVFAQLGDAQALATQLTGQTATWTGKAFRNLPKRDHLGYGPASAHYKLFQLMQRDGDAHRLTPRVATRGTPNAKSIADIIKGVRNLNFFVPEPARGLERYFDNRPGRIYRLMPISSKRTGGTTF